MKLNLLERRVAIQLCKVEAGDFMLYKLLSEGRNALAFTQDEVKEFEYTEKPNVADPSKTDMQFNLEKGLEEREIDLNETTVDVIRKTLVKLNDDKALLPDQITLYIKFVNPMEENTQEVAAVEVVPVEETVTPTEVVAPDAVVNPEVAVTAPENVSEAAVAPIAAVEPVQEAQAPSEVVEPVAPVEAPAEAAAE